MLWIIYKCVRRFADSIKRCQRLYVPSYRLHSVSFCYHMRFLGNGESDCFWCICPIIGQLSMNRCDFHIPLSGENFSLWRESECARPRRVALTSAGCKSCTSEGKCSLMAR